MIDHFSAAFDAALAKRASTERRLGLELKFPLVERDGTAVPRETVAELWRFLAARGWTPAEDRVTGEVVGCTHPGEQNDTVASCETGYCKTEFSLAHAADLHGLAEQATWLREQLGEFSQQHNVRLLGFGIHPVSPPGRALELKKVRASVWDRAVPSNRVIPPEEGDDVHLLTINAGSHVHVGIDRDEAVRAVNVLCGLAGPQIALMANSNVWRGQLDPNYKAVSEMLWDWWEPAAGRRGVPNESFTDLKHYVSTIERMKPIYVKRDGVPLLLPEFETFADYFAHASPTGRNLDGQDIALVPEPADIDLHNSCYWFNARISRYFTVENRIFDQQPPDDLLLPAAITLGLVSALDEACEEIAAHDWQDLRAARESACRDGMQATLGGRPIVEACGRMLDLIELGLRRRDRGEVVYLEPLKQRLKEQRCPADEVAEIVRADGIPALVERRAI